MNYDKLKLDQQLCFPLYVCSKEVIKKYKPFLDEINLTYTQYIVMLALWEKDNIFIKDLGDILYLDSGTLTPLLKKLEALKLVIRERLASDERNVIIKLTNQGIKLKDKAITIPEKVGQCINITADEAKILHQLLYKVINQSNMK